MVLLKVVVILGGLGSQMFKYAFYLSLKEKAKDDCYICTIPFYMSDMWNGYELNKIFGIEAPDIIDFIETKESLQRHRQHAVGEKTGDYAAYILRFCKSIDAKTPVYRVNRGYVIKYDLYLYEPKCKIERALLKIYFKFMNMLTPYKFSRKGHIDHYPKSYAELKGNILYDEFNHTSDEYIKCLNYDLKNVFIFPEFDENENIILAEELLKTESVALHVRRSDHLYDNQSLFDSGYFKKAVEFVKSKVKNPFFCIFSEECEWCKHNLDALGLDISTDRIVFADWNTGEKSYRDMQLMTYCRHNILTISSFGWWGYYLSKHVKKIVCAPDGYWFEIETHF